MSGAMIEVRAEEVISASINQSAGGSLTVGPFAHDAVVQRFGAVITTALTVGNVAVTTNANVGSATLPNGTAAGKVVVKDAVKNPAAGEGEQPEQYVLPKGSTFTVTGAAVASSAGAYRLFAEVIKKPLHVDGVNVLAG